ncbi:MAG: NAD(+)/NADH kinase [Lachnospiraceae bacterium]|nr:NAD(+)/NADH kinase [Lachnospiraceae bacterium]
MTKTIEEFLRERGFDATVNVAEEMKEGSYTNTDLVPKETDCLIVVGGDGTLIAAARDTTKLSLPILGVNQGKMGYLADAEVEHLDEALKQLIEGDFEIEERMMLSGRIYGADGTFLYESDALNDVILHVMGELHVADYQVSVNDKFLGNFLADGIIVCTPTGSTAYSMSAGGPIIEPMARMMVITPICPHTLNTRSIVLSEEDRVGIAVPNGNSSTFFDGQDAGLLEAGGYVEICRSEHVTRIIRIHPSSFLTLLSKKFQG